MVHFAKNDNILYVFAEYSNNCNAFLTLAVIFSNALINAKYIKYRNMIKTKTNYMKPSAGTKFLRNLQLESMFLNDLIFCLKISSD